MLKKLLAACAALLATAAFAAVDANKATRAELEAIAGIGPSTSTMIIDERKKSEFKDWTDFVTRVKGVGDRSATKFSEGGLTVNGKAYPGAPGATKVAQASSGAKSESAGTRAVDATKSAAGTAASTVKTGAKGVASGFKSTGSDIAGAAKEEAHAAKESAAGAKAKMTGHSADKAKPASAPAK